MHSVSSNAVAESLSYYATEHKTGGVWLDGKPLYRKVIVKENFQYNTYINDVLDNPDTVIKYDMTIKNSNGAVYSGNMTSDSIVYITEIIYLQSNNKIFYTGGNARGTLPKVIFNFLYTKTTD